MWKKPVTLSLGPAFCQRVLSTSDGAWRTARGGRPLGRGECCGWKALCRCRGDHGRPASSPEAQCRACTRAAGMGQTGTHRKLGLGKAGVSGTEEKKYKCERALQSGQKPWREISCRQTSEKDWRLRWKQGSSHRRSNCVSGNPAQRCETLMVTFLAWS